MSALRARLAQLEAAFTQPVSEGLYVVIAPDVSSDGPIASFHDETLADELCEALGNPTAEVFFEPAADDDKSLLRELVEKYVDED